MVNNLIFIKLGGSAITDKRAENSLNKEVLDQAAREISELCKSCKVLVGFGGGSFAHPVAKKHNVRAGLKNSSIEGFMKTRHAVDALGKIVLNSLKSAGVPAVYVPTFACALMKNGKISTISSSPIEALLAGGKVPVIPGDAVLDSEQVFSIASTEMIFSHLASSLKLQAPSRVLIGSDVDGVLAGGKVVSEITPKNIAEILEKAGDSAGTDVTGGMKHKLQELCNISKLGIEVQIFNLKKQGLLARAARGEAVGTVLR